MKAQATTVHKLLQGSKVFLIPTFQRRYRWKKEQWSQLWSDLLHESTLEHPHDPEILSGHFLGSVVLHPAVGPASTLMRHQVIDGQQRLTTILIMLAALRDVRRSVDTHWDADSIDKQYLTNPYSDDDPDRLVPTKLDREAYINTVRGGRPTGDIGIAYNYFRAEIEHSLESGLDLEKLQNTLLLHLLIVEINTKTGDSVNSIFNTLNSKGMDLSPADLVRNELLHHVGDRMGDEAHEKYWIPMELHLVNPRVKSPDREFVTFLWSREVAINPKTSRDDLFSAFERRLRVRLADLTADARQKASLELLKEVYRDHELFLIVRDPSLARQDARISVALCNALQDLRDWRAEPATPISLWVLKAAVEGEIDQEDAAATLGVLLSYLVKRVLHGIPTNQLNRLLTPVAYELSNRPAGESAREHLTALLSKPGYYWPTDDQVLASVATNPIYASAHRYVKFLLSVAERQLPGTESADLSRSQIDHVMPQSLPASWIDYIEQCGGSAVDADALVHTLGNLTLSENNQRMGESLFDVKRDEFFENSAIRLNRELAEYAMFTPEAIQVRSRRLARAIVDAFPQGPRTGKSVPDGERTGASPVERLESLLQSIPIERWVGEEELTSVLAVRMNELRPIVNSFDATLARLIRDSEGRVPDWIGDGLRMEIARQDGTSGGVGQKLDDAALRQLLHAAELSTVDDEDDEDASVSV